MTAPPRLAMWLLSRTVPAGLPGRRPRGSRGGVRRAGPATAGRTTGAALVLAPGVLARCAPTRWRDATPWPPVFIHRGQIPCDMIFAMRCVPCSRSPAYTLTAIAVLALGIGATTLDLQLRRRRAAAAAAVPEPRAHRVRLREAARRPAQRRRDRELPGLAGRRTTSSRRSPRRRPSTMTLAGTGETARLRVGRVSAGYFDVFGIRAVPRAHARCRTTSSRDAIASSSCRIARGSRCSAADRGDRRARHRARWPDVHGRSA